MQPVAVVAVEGVLRKPVTGHATPAGRRLYHGLASQYRLVLVTTGTDRAQFAEFAGTEGFTRHDHVVYGDHVAPVAESWWVHVVRTLKLAHGYDTELVVVSDPGDATVLIGDGFTVMLYVPAAYSLPEWRPDHRDGIRPWADLEAEVQAQRRLRAEDRRWAQEELF